MCVNVRSQKIWLFGFEYGGGEMGYVGDVSNLSQLRLSVVVLLGKTAYCGFFF